MNDYTTKAKADFSKKQGKIFEHNIVYNILRRSLPKYEIYTATTGNVLWIAMQFASLQNSLLQKSLPC
jgi:hypothetical protein